MRLGPYGAVLLLMLTAASTAQEVPAQNSESRRIFAQSVTEVRAALGKVPGGTSGRLPTLDGFVISGTHPLSSYQRPFYQCEVRVTAAKIGGSQVQVTAKITAWFSDPAHPGYQALVSNGRVESDLLDRLQDALEGASAESKNHAPALNSQDGSLRVKPAAPQVDAPVPQLPGHVAALGAASQGPAVPQDSQLQQEANNLEEILRNQSHPTNLIAVKQDGTPVLQSPAVDAKVLFLASAEDEFEVLDETPGWVHVRISGLARGWLRRTLVEVPGDSQVDPAVGLSSSAEAAPALAPATTAAFSVSSEEVGGFPGDWAPLKGKSVKIISLQQAAGSGRITSPQEKKEFAAELFKKESRGLVSDAAGVVLVFDAEDGGMIAATRATLDQWNSGALSDALFWRQCYLDPPEILGTN